MSINKKLKSDVFKLSPKQIKRDEDGLRYIPICSYGWHIGIIRDETKCLELKCKHYERHYLNSRNYFNEVKKWNY